MVNAINRAYMTTTTTGTGTINLGVAVSGYGSFSGVGAVNGTQYPYCLLDGVNFEIGLGTYSSGVETFTRTTVNISKISGVYGTTKINLSGNGTVFVDVRAQDLIGCVQSALSSTLLVGYPTTGFNGGTVSSGTFTPNVANGHMQYYTNNGAHTLAAPTASGDYVINLLVTNGTTAGAISYSGWTKNPSGDTLTTTNTQKFWFSVGKCNGVTWAAITAMQ